MPKLERVQVATYVYPHVAQHLKTLAGTMGYTLSQTVEILLRWGIYALQVEDGAQGLDLETELADVAGALAFGGAGFGPTEPARPVDRAVDDVVRGQRKDLDQRWHQRLTPDAAQEAGEQSEAASADAEAERLARLIREIVREELAAQS